MIAEKKRGRPKGSIVQNPNKLDFVKEKKEIEIFVPQVRNEFCCSVCGKKYTKQKDNFPASQSPLYFGNNRFLDICVHCLDQLTLKYEKDFGNQEDAIQRVCMKYDIYFNQSLLGASKKISADRSRIRTYISRANLNQYQNKTYDTYLFELENDKINSIEDINDISNEKDARRIERLIKKFGLGFSEAEYLMLDEHYKMLQEQIDDEDFIQETLIRDLCNIKIQQIRSMQDKDVDKYDKLTKLYQSTLSSANLKPKSSKANGNNITDSWGSFIFDIEKYAPAEYYADKKKYKDFDGIGEYFQRFLFRPLKNLMTGSKELDKEFNINEIKEDV